MFFNLYRKDADTTCRGVWNFLAAALAALVIMLTMDFLGRSGMVPSNWALNLHLTPFNLIGAVLLWIFSGAVALGMLLVAGRNLPLLTTAASRTGRFRSLCSSAWSSSARL